MKKNSLLIAIIFAFLAVSCKKTSGPGGTLKIAGKIWVEDYNTLNNSADIYTLKGEYPGVDEDVYIIYGNDVSYGSKVKSGPDGRFEFPYLRAGDYKIYLQSRDTTRTSISASKTVETSISISGKKKTFDAGTLVIYK